MYTIIIYTTGMGAYAVDIMHNYAFSTLPLCHATRAKRS